MRESERAERQNNGGGISTRSDEGIRSPEARVACGCELPDAGAGN